MGLENIILSEVTWREKKAIISGEGGRNLGGQLLAITNKATMNIVEHMPLKKTEYTRYSPQNSKGSTS